MDTPRSKKREYTIQGLRDAASTDYDLEESLAAAREITRSRREAGANGFYGATDGLQLEGRKYDTIVRDPSPLQTTRGLAQPDSTEPPLGTLSRQAFLASPAPSVPHSSDRYPTTPKDEEDDDESESTDWGSQALLDGGARAPSSEGRQLQLRMQRHDYAAAKKRARDAKKRAAHGGASKSKASRASASDGAPEARQALAPEILVRRAGASPDAGSSNRSPSTSTRAKRLLLSPESTAKFHEDACAGLSGRSQAGTPQSLAGYLGNSSGTQPGYEAPVALSPGKRYVPRSLPSSPADGESGGGRLAVVGGGEQEARVLKRVDSSGWGGSRTAERAVERAVRRAQRAARAAESAQLAAARRQAGLSPLPQEEGDEAAASSGNGVSPGDFSSRPRMGSKKPKSSQARKGGSTRGRSFGRARAASRGSGSRAKTTSSGRRVREAVASIETGERGKGKGKGAEELFASPPHPRTYMADAVGRGASSHQTSQRPSIGVRGWGTVPVPEGSAASFVSPPLSRLDADRAHSTPGRTEASDHPASGGTAMYWRYGSVAGRTASGRKLKSRGTSRGKSSNQKQGPVHTSIGRAAMAAIDQARRGSNPPDGVVLVYRHDGADASGIVEAVDAESPRGIEARRYAHNEVTRWADADFDESGKYGQGSGSGEADGDGGHEDPALEDEQREPAEEDDDAVGRSDKQDIRDLGTGVANDLSRGEDSQAEGKGPSGRREPIAAAGVDDFSPKPGVHGARTPSPSGNGGLAATDPAAIIQSPFEQATAEVAAEMAADDDGAQEAERELVVEPKNEPVATVEPKAQYYAILGAPEVASGEKQKAYRSGKESSAGNPSSDDAGSAATPAAVASDDQVLELAKASGVPAGDLDAVLEALHAVRQSKSVDEEARKGAPADGARSDGPQAETAERQSVAAASTPGTSTAVAAPSSGLMAMRRNLRGEAWGDVKMGPFAMGFHSEPEEPAVDATVAGEGPSESRAATLQQQLEGSPATRTAMRDLSAATHSPAGRPIPPATAATASMAPALEPLAAKGWQPANDAFVKDRRSSRQGRSRRSSIGVASPTRAIRSKLGDGSTSASRNDDLQLLFGMRGVVDGVSTRELKPRRIGGWLSTAAEGDEGTGGGAVASAPLAAYGAYPDQAQSKVHARRRSSTSRRGSASGLASRLVATASLDYRSKQAAASESAAADAAVESATVTAVDAAVLSGSEALQSLGAEPAIEGQDASADRAGAQRGAAADQVRTDMYSQDPDSEPHASSDQLQKHDGDGDRGEVEQTAISEYGARSPAEAGHDEHPITRLLRGRSQGMTIPAAPAVQSAQPSPPRPAADLREMARRLQQEVKEQFKSSGSLDELRSDSPDYGIAGTGDSDSQAELPSSASGSRMRRLQVPSDDQEVPEAPPTAIPTEGDVFGATGLADGVEEVEEEDVAGYGDAEENDGTEAELLPSAAPLQNDTAASLDGGRGSQPSLRRIHSKPDLPTAARGIVELQETMSPTSRKVHEEYLARTRRRRQEQLRDRREHDARLAALRRPESKASRLLQASSSRARALMYDRFRRGYSLPLRSQTGGSASAADRFAAAMSNMPAPAKLYVEAAAEAEPSAPLGELARTTAGRNPEYDFSQQGLLRSQGVEQVQAGSGTRRGIRRSMADTLYVLKYSKENESATAVRADRTVVGGLAEEEGFDETESTAASGVYWKRQRRGSISLQTSWAGDTISDPARWQQRDAAHSMQESKTAGSDEEVTEEASFLATASGGTSRCRKPGNRGDVEAVNVSFADALRSLHATGRKSGDGGSSDAEKLLEASLGMPRSRQQGAGEGVARNTVTGAGRAAGGQRGRKSARGRLIGKAATGLTAAGGTASTSGKLAAYNQAYAAAADAANSQRGPSDETPEERLERELRLMRDPARTARASQAGQLQGAPEPSLLSPSGAAGQVGATGMGHLPVKAGSGIVRLTQESSGIAPSLPSEAALSATAQEMAEADARIQKELAASIDGRISGNPGGHRTGGASAPLPFDALGPAHSEWQGTPLAGSIRKGRSGALLPRGGPSDVFSPQHTGPVLPGGLSSPNRTRNLVPLLPAGSYLGIVQGGGSREAKGKSSGRHGRSLGKTVTVFDAPRRKATTPSSRRGGRRVGGARQEILPDRTMLKAALRYSGRG